MSRQLMLPKLYGFNIYTEPFPKVNLSQWEREQQEHNERAAEMAKERLRTGRNVGKPYTHGIECPPRKRMIEEGTAFMLGTRGMYLSPRDYMGVAKLTGLSA